MHVRALKQQESSKLHDTQSVGLILMFVPSSHNCHLVLSSKNKTQRFFLAYKQCVCVCVWVILTHICGTGIGRGRGCGEAALFFKYFYHQFNTTQAKQPVAWLLVCTVHTLCIFPPFECLNAQVAACCLQGEYLFKMDIRIWNAVYLMKAALKHTHTHGLCTDI